MFLDNLRQTLRLLGFRSHVLIMLKLWRVLRMSVWRKCTRMSRGWRRCLVQTQPTLVCVSGSTGRDDYTEKTKQNSVCYSASFIVQFSNPPRPPLSLSVAQLQRESCVENALVSNCSEIPSIQLQELNLAVSEVEFTSAKRLQSC